MRNNRKKKDIIFIQFGIGIIFLKSNLWIVGCFLIFFFLLWNIKNPKIRMSKRQKDFIKSLPSPPVSLDDYNRGIEYLKIYPDGGNLIDDLYSLYRDWKLDGNRKVGKKR